MVRLREQIEPSNTLHSVFLSTHLLLTLPHNHADIPRLCVHVTTNVHHNRATKVDQLVDELLVLALPWRVDDHSSLVSRERLDCSKDIRSIAFQE